MIGAGGLGHPMVLPAEWKRSFSQSLGPPARAAPGLVP